MKIYFLFRRSAMFRCIWGLLLFPAAVIFRGLVILHKIFITKTKVDFPVIGVGNLTVGGTGKTPFTIWLGQILLERGKKPVIFTTGYKEHQSSDDEAFGDESFEIKANLSGVQVISGRNRRENLLNYSGKNIAILDDSYQQWSLEKTLEILLIDSTFPFGNGLTIPAGILREPISSLNRSNLILLTHTDEIPEYTLTRIIQRLQRKMKRDIPIFKSIHYIKDFVNQKNTQITREELNDKKVITISGIAGPYSFIHKLEQLGIQIEKRFIFPDHHNYLKSEVTEIMEYHRNLKTDYIITTQKDFVKLSSLTELPDNLIYSNLQLKIENEEKLTKIILDKL